jgi:hypothetical protein
MDEAVGGEEEEGLGEGVRGVVIVVVVVAIRLCVVGRMVGR